MLRAARPHSSVSQVCRLYIFRNPIFKLASLDKTCGNETHTLAMYMDNFAKTRLSRRYATLERGENLAKNPWYKEPKYMVGMVVVPLLVAIIMIAPGILFPQPTSPRAINDIPLMKLDNNINVSPIINNNNQNIITNGDTLNVDKNPTIAPLNQPPFINALDPAPSSPQTAGANITWTTDASDPDNDKIYYQYLLNGNPVTGWEKHNEWTWPTSEKDIGNNTIEVLVRDKNHAGTSGSDDHRPASFAILSPEPIYEMQTSSNNVQTQQPNQTTSSEPVRTFNSVKYDSTGKAVAEIEPGTIKLSGKGAGISNKFTLENGLAIFATKCLGSEVFTAQLANLDGTNKRVIARTLFNGFNGTTALGISTTGDYKLDISYASSPWTVNITQPRPQTAQEMPVSFRGINPQVQFVKLRPGPATFILNHDGNSYFSVSLLDLKGNVVDDVASESGILTNASKTISIKDGGIYCIEIDTNDNWKIDVS